MNTATNPPTQGGRPSWELICIADSLIELEADHAFLTVLYDRAMGKRDSMDTDLLRLLAAYMEGNPRQRLQQASDDLAAIARKLPRQSE